MKCGSYVDGLMIYPFIIGTGNARDMLKVGDEILRDGGSAMDAVEATIRAVEENPLDPVVGLGGASGSELSEGG